MSFSSTLSPNVVKTALDDVFFQTFSGEKYPGVVDATSSMVFKQDTTDSSAVIEEVFKGVGAWEQRSEEQDLSQGNPRIGNQKTFSVANFARSIDIPKIFFDDNKHSSYEKMVSNFARRARTTRSKNAFAVFRNAFTTATTSDGVALISDSHINLNGDTIDNKVTGALSETTLNTAIVQLMEMKSQDGEIDGFLPNVLLVPPALYKTACEIVDSEQRSGTADNDINIYSSKYGIYVAQSPYLGAASGGSDAAWFLLSEDHSIMRYVRQDIITDIVDYKFQRNNNYIYKGEFREVVGAMSFEGIVGSTGA